MVSVEKQLEKEWTTYGVENLVGKTVMTVKYLSRKETDAMGWDKRTLVIKFTDGSLIYASADDEGNEAGSLFGRNENGEDLLFPVL